MDERDEFSASFGASPVRPRWGLGDAALGFGLGFVAQTLAATAALTGSGAQDVASLSIDTLLLLQIPLWLGLAGVSLVAAWRKGSGPVADFGLRLRPFDLPTAALLGVVLQAALVPLVYWPVFRLFPSITEDDVSASAREVVEKAHGWNGVVLLVLMVVIIAPIVEEVFFRGLLLRSLERRTGAPAAVVISAVLFALSHFQGIQLPALLLVGLVAGVLVVRTNRLGTAIVAHMAFNGWAVFTLLNG